VPGIPNPPLKKGEIDPFEIIGTLVRISDPGDALQEVLRLVTKWFDADSGQIILNEFETGNPQVKAISTGLRGADLSFSTTILNRALEADESLCIGDAKKHPLYRSAQSVSDVEGAFLSVIVVPLHNEEGLPWGALYLQRREDEKRPFDEAYDLGNLSKMMDSLTPILCSQQQQRYFNGLRIQHVRETLGEMGYIVGQSKRMDDIYGRIEKFSSADLTVCIQGETGSGKEVAANAIHKLSPRADKPFVKIPCNAIPRELAESEFFGHVKGAYSEAHTDKPGQFEMANGGTIFLDEIGKLSLDVQAKLLHALEGGPSEAIRFFRVGGVSKISVDVRVLVATNADLKQGVKEGAFREDLFYRLHQLVIHVPSLRERREDILPLAEGFLRQANDSHMKSAVFSTTALDALLEHDWPGNVRELRSCIHSAVLLLDEDRPLTPEDLFPGTESEAQAVLDSPDIPFRDMSRIQKHHAVKAAMERFGGNARKAAEALGVSHQTIYNYLEEDKGRSSS
jgi:transcriptional regulator with GAF, ATPase, and Fis domain